MSAYHDSMSQLVTRCYRRLGFRGRFLLLVGLAYLAQGVVTLETWGIAPHDYAPPWLRATLWAGSGFIAIVTAWRPVRETNPIGWLALYVPPAAWSSSYAVGWVGHLAPQLGIPYAYESGAANALVWGLVVAVVMVCADWPEPPANQGEVEVEGGGAP